MDKYLRRKTSTRYPMWRWWNYVHRTWAWMWNSMFFFWVSFFFCYNFMVCGECAQKIDWLQDASNLLCIHCNLICFMKKWKNDTRFCMVSVTDNVMKFSIWKALQIHYINYSIYFSDYFLNNIYILQPSSPQRVDENTLMSFSMHYLLFFFFSTRIQLTVVT